ncbi:MAG: hypothetical protein JEZ14_14115 [Marinilabiliaceae bacterium]|nr:hypothetical protein [Marinilabiliaceae bacterium]
MKQYFKTVIIMVAIGLGVFLNKTENQHCYNLNTVMAECIPVDELPEGGSILLMYNCSVPRYFINGCEDTNFGTCTNNANR